MIQIIQVSLQKDTNVMTLIKLKGQEVVVLFACALPEYRSSLFTIIARYNVIS